ncbi:cysteine hydrolase family protein [Oricola thermophila]|uniref:Cysteine hydrolase n=1 Tax=Oricola thermophila TaxID=2742145 RepID=A0A6N1VF06_9HYPH|nr:isochorismatase family cysteine hydrolase [Oricola thermophila]QKV19123.1 cysteine hydrolase [Oricola thermophila]
MIELTKKDTALIVVDMQRGFFSSDDTVSRSGLDVTALRAAIPGSVRLVKLARAANVPVIFTRYVYSAGMADFGVIRNEMDQKRRDMNSLGYDMAEIELIDELEVRPDEVVIDKSRPSAFYGTRLEPVLTASGIRNVVICGVTTNICVEGTARDAGQRDYGTFVVRDAVAEFTKERNDHALNTIDWFFGVTVDIADVERAWAA